MIELACVERRFGALVAVTGASARFEPGAIHAVIGENGAGKSTLLKLAAGALAPTGGVVTIDGARLDPATPAEAIRRGVGLVHQHFMLVGAFRALENVMLGSEPTRGVGRLDEAHAERRARALMSEARLELPLEALTSALTVGERQRLEILRVLYRGARALLLDEPTAVLSPLEAEDLYATLRRIADAGSTVVVVTHRLDEVARFADHVTVMRRGQVVLSEAGGGTAASPARSREDELTRAIMGGEVPPAFSPPSLAPGAPAALEVRGLALDDGAGRRVLAGLDLSVRAGEIVGVAGVEGNGQRELARALAGLEPRATGGVLVGGRDLSGASVQARREVLGVVHEDRQTDGLLLDATVGDNLVLGDLGALGERAARGAFAGEGPPRARERQVVERRLERFGIHPAEPSRLAGELSGGNQQKILIARTLDRLRGARAGAGQGALVLAQPTRGVDVGAAATIHAAIGEAARAGLGVLLISADLTELRTVCHRLLVMRRGSIAGAFAVDASDTAIGRAMLGLSTEPAA